MYHSILLVLSCSVFNSAVCAVEPIELTRSQWLGSSQSAFVRWGFSGYESTDVITFEVTAKTLGWVGFGLSPNGGMKNSDIVIGGVDGAGKPYLYDMHASCNCQPEPDAHADYQLEDARQNDTHTVLRFSRQLHTCDPEDYPITPDTVRFLWAMHSEDASSPTSFSKHAFNDRGARSLFPLQRNNPMPDIEMPADVIAIDFLVHDVKIPDDYHTMYWCKVFELPNLGKHHMIKYTPILTPGNEPFLHHIVVYTCGNNMSLEVGKQEECFNRNVTEFSDLGKCRSTTFAVWAVGSDGVVVPESYGIPVMEEGSSPFLIIEVHYDNSGHRPTPILDNSGMRIYLTPTLRPTEYGSLVTGMGVSAEALLIPPGQNTVTLYSVCDFQCTQNFPADGITVASGFLHEHVAGKAVRLRHFRNGVELPPIIADEHYDFNYQDQIYMQRPVKIMPNDTLLTECDYFSNEKTEPIYGGFGTPQEMCFVFMTYYPRTDGVENCIGGPTMKTWASAMKTEVHGDIGKVFTHPESKANITIKEFSKLVEWGTADAEEELSEMGHYFQNRIKEGTYWESCGGQTGKMEAEDEVMMEMFEKNELEAEKRNKTKSILENYGDESSMDEEDSFEDKHPSIQDVKYDFFGDIKLNLPDRPYRAPTHCSSQAVMKLQEDENSVSMKRKSLLSQEVDDREEDKGNDNDNEESNLGSKMSLCSVAWILVVALAVMF